MDVHRRPAGFAVASAVGGAAQSFGVLVGARALQGAFAALLAPAALSLLTTTFTDPAERGKAFGIYGAIAGVGGAIGLLLGGVLTEYLDWRWCLYVSTCCSPSRRRSRAQPSCSSTSARPCGPQLDLPGTLTAPRPVRARVRLLQRGDQRLGRPVTSAAIGSAVLLAAFVVLAGASRHPLLPLRVVLDRDRGGSFLAIGIAGAGMFGVFLFLTYYLQQTPASARPDGPGVPADGRRDRADRDARQHARAAAHRPASRSCPPACRSPPSAMVLLTGIGVERATAHVLPALLVIGSASASSSPRRCDGDRRRADEDAGVASAMVNTTQQIGGSLGTALLSTLAVSATTGSCRQGRRPRCRPAAVHGYTTAFWWSAGIFAAGALVTGVLLRSGDRRARVHAGPEPVPAHS